MPDQTKNCSRCGKEIKAEARICRFCRAEQTGSTTGSTRKCPSCGKEIKAEARICRFCRIELGAAPAQGPPAARAQKPRSEPVKRPPEPAVQRPPTYLSTIGRRDARSRAFAILAYALFLPGAAIAWLANRENTFVKFHAVQAALFDLAAILLYLPSLGQDYFSTALYDIYLVGAGIFWLIGTIYVLIAMFHATAGRARKLTLAGDIAERFVSGKSSTREPADYVRLASGNGQAGWRVAFAATAGIVAVVGLIFARYSAVTILLLIAALALAAWGLSRWARGRSLVTAILSLSVVCAVSLLAAFIVTGSMASTKYTEAKTLVEQGKFDEATVAYDNTQRDFPLTLANDDGSQAQAECRTALAAASLQQAGTLYSQGDLSGALGAYNKILEYYPQHPGNVEINRMAQVCNTRLEAVDKLEAASGKNGKDKFAAYFDIMAKYGQYPEAGIALAALKAEVLNHAVAQAELYLGAHEQALAAQSAFYYYRYTPVRDATVQQWQDMSAFCANDPSGAGLSAAYAKAVEAAGYVKQVEGTSNADTMQVWCGKARQALNEARAMLQ